MSVIALTRWSRIVLFLLLSLTWAIGGTLAGPNSRANLGKSDQRQAVQAGVKLERDRQWVEAIQHYEDSVKVWPDSKDLKYGLRRAKIQFGVERRYTDSSFQKTLLKLSRHEALNLFDEILQKVRVRFVEPLSSTSFVAHGTESLYLALSNEKFLETHLPRTNQDRVNQLRRNLREQFWNKPIAHRHAARQTVEQVCNIASNITGLSSGAVVMEYVFGGCNALDDYSNYLTPDRLDDLYGNIDGEFVGLGIEMKAEIGKGLLMVDVLPESPAADGGILAGDHIVTVDGNNCRFMTTDEAANLLKGPSGSRIRIEIESPLAAKTRQATLVRRAVQVKSIPAAKMLDQRQGIAYIRLSGFQKTTANEMDEALSKLRRQGMRSLIWDVRGNPGGLLTAAVEVLDRFIDDGVLVSTKGRTADQNWSYSAHRPGTTNIPIVLLTDGNSASASEIVAGAIHDHRRGTIVGRQTYGKWSVQSIFPVRGATGLRLTTAKFYSPHGHTLGKIGVRPDVIVEASQTQQTYYRGAAEADMSSDPDISKGLEILRNQSTRR